MTQKPTTISIGEATMEIPLDRLVVMLKQETIHRLGVYLQSQGNMDMTYDEVIQDWVKIKEQEHERI